MSAQKRGIPCPVCQVALAVRLATGRKSGKPFVSLICGQDGRHFRGFIADKGFIAQFAQNSLGSSGLGEGREAGTL